MSYDFEEKERKQRRKINSGLCICMADIYTWSLISGDRQSTNKSIDEYNDDNGRLIAYRLLSRKYTTIYECSDASPVEGYGRPDLLVYTGTGKNDYVIVECKLRKEGDAQYALSPFIKYSKSKLMDRYMRECHPDKDAICLYMYSEDLWTSFRIRPDKWDTSQIVRANVCNEDQQQLQYRLNASQLDVISKNLRALLKI